jgi:hypothetical protein
MSARFSRGFFATISSQLQSNRVELRAQHRIKMARSMIAVTNYRTSISCCMAAVLWALVASASGAPPRVGFNDKIRPILTKHCTECHGGVKQASELSFTYPEQVLPPDGWVIEPGKPDESILIERVTSEDEEFRMPPAEHGPALSKRETELLAEWIRQGAKWERPWAFEAPQRHALPQVQSEVWCRSPIDRFIMSRLDEEKLRPNPEASAGAWLRRVSLDLIGLPPTPEERAAFLKDVDERGEAAYSAAVDRLLASPQFGERWASVWLDQIRYADSRGLGFDNRRNIWKYRDWVIDAFNRDLPYDEFTVKQIAGDLLPTPTMDDLVASACQRLTMANDEGGTDDEEFRVEAVLDRVNTVSQAWLGMTFGCARCHDHPYEPVRHDEYYQLAAYFNNTQDSDMNEEHPLVKVPIDPADYAKADDLDKRIATLRRTIWEADDSLASDDRSWRSLREISARTNNATQVEVENKADHAEYYAVGTIVSQTDFTIEAPLVDWSGPLTAIRVTCMPHDPVTALRDSEWGFVLSSVEAKLIDGDGERPLKLAYVIGDEADPILDPQESLNPKSGEGFAAYTRINQPRSAAFVLKEPMDVRPGSRLQVVLRNRKQVNASFSLIARRGHFAVSSNPAFTELLKNANRAQWIERLARLEKKRQAIESTAVPVMRERPDHLRRPTYTFVRGFYLTKDKEVTPNVPASLPGLPAGAAPNRLTLARWIVSPQNPFTARVAVNRFWARLFGAGLVLTEEDFGSTGDAPSHPELLDDLAVRFRTEMGWSVKKLLRELVLSSTYRQDAKRRPELLKRDPANRLLAQGPRMRLGAEVMRDQALAVSGLLSTKQFGPPVYPPIPKGVWKPFQSGDKWNTPPVGDPDRYRRTIYTYTKRTIPYPVVAAFDAPSRETCASRRMPSNTPIQAFVTLNDETFVECAGALAERMIEGGQTLREQLAHGFLLATCRPAREAELDDLSAFVEGLPAGHDELARMTLAASVLLNLDEVITK